MRIQDIPPFRYDPTVYIVGTGPSLRCLDLSFLTGRNVIGLNQAWRHLPVAYSITVHPELVADEVRERRLTRWVVKKKAPLSLLKLDDPHHYVFGTSYELSAVTTRPDDTLYLGEGVQTCAMDLAARLGAKHIVLVGCDGDSLGGDFHAHDQHVRWLGMAADTQYSLYRASTAEVRAALRPMGVSVMSLTPFIGVTAAEEDYARLRVELKLQPLPAPVDTSPYVRDPKTIRTGK